MLMGDHTPCLLAAYHSRSPLAFSGEAPVTPLSPRHSRTFWLLVHQPSCGGPERSPRISLMSSTFSQPACCWRTLTPTEFWAETWHPLPYRAECPALPRPPGQPAWLLPCVSMCIHIPELPEDSVCVRFPEEASPSTEGRLLVA